MEVSGNLSNFATMNARRDKQKRQQPQLNSQLEAIDAIKEKRWRECQLDKWKSEVLTDLAKLIFAGVIIGGIFEQIDNPIILYTAGIFGFSITLTMGFVYYKRGLNNEH